MIRTHGRRKGSNSQYIRTRSHNHRSDSNSWPKYTSTYCIKIRTHDSTGTFWVKKLLQFAVFKHIWKSSVKLMKLLYFSTTSIDFFYSPKSRFSRLMPSENINWYYSVAESRAGAEFEFSNQGAGADPNHNTCRGVSGGWLQAPGMSGSHTSTGWRSPGSRSNPR